MATLNRTDRLTLDAFSDPQLAGPVYNRFTNRLKNPLLGVKGVQLVNLNTVNCSLPLNDDNGQLMFFYYASGTLAGMCVAANLKCVRLVPSWYVPALSVTTFVRNQLFASGTELATALTSASSTNGDSVTYNPYWVQNQLTFTFDTTTRRFTVASTGGGEYIAPAAADDPNVLAVLNGTASNGFIKLRDFNTTSYATARVQPSGGLTMNSRLGFSLRYDQNGTYWNSNSQRGCATATGVPYNAGIVADTPPILLGVQNIGVYLSIVTGGGTDSKGRKNLIGVVPMEAPPYAVQSYTMCSVEVPSLSTANEIYEITCELICPETGAPYNVWQGANTSVGLVFYY